MQIIAVDILGPLPKTGNGNCYVLVATDYDTRWVEAYAIPDQGASTVAQKSVKSCSVGSRHQSSSTLIRGAYLNRNWLLRCVSF